MTASSNAIDDLAPALARWLAPYVADELRNIGAPPLPRADYDDAVCAEFVRELGTPVLNRGQDFFSRLDRDGEVDAPTMAGHLSLGTPRNISGIVTTPIKRRAKKLGLRVPWEEAISPERRTCWIDRDGIAARMVDAIKAEQHHRSGPS